VKTGVDSPASKKTENFLKGLAKSFHLCSSAILKRDRRVVRFRRSRFARRSKPIQRGVRRMAKARREKAIVDLLTTAGHGRVGSAAARCSVGPAGAAAPRERLFVAANPSATPQQF